MNTSEYLGDAFRVISEHFRSNDPTGGMTAASAAYLVKRVVGDHREFGFPKFKDVLTALANEGRVRTGSNSKNAFSLWLTEGAPKLTAPIQPSDRFRALRNQVWSAFITGEYAGRRYLNRTTGETRVRCSEPPGELWVEIEPVSADDEREHARQFLEKNEIDCTDCQDAIAGERWYIDFPQKLAMNSPQLAAQWKRERSLRVIDYVMKWCDQNNVEQKLVYESLVPAKPQGQFPLGNVVHAVGATNYDLRNALLESIRRMSTDELLRIPIPASHLISVLRPDLLR